MMVGRTPRLRAFAFVSVFPMCGQAGGFSRQARAGFFCGRAPGQGLSTTSVTLTGGWIVMVLLYVWSRAKFL